MLILTDEDILQDIENFKKRIQDARGKLDMLPTGHLPYPEHKKREKQRRDLLAEIKHVQKMRGYAEEATADA
jgi:hypothetical protein